MPVLIALAGFVVFLCVFGLRGLMIAGAVFGCAAVIVLGAIAADNQRLATAKQQREAANPFPASKAECLARFPRGYVNARNPDESVEEFFCRTTFR